MSTLKLTGNTVTIPLMQDQNESLHTCEMCGSKSDNTLSNQVGELYVCDVCFRKYEKRSQTFKLTAVKPVLERVFVVVVLGYWGKGITLADAAKQCRKAGAKGSDTVVSYLYIRESSNIPEKALFTEVWVDGMGEINYPSAAISTYICGPTQGTTVKLSALCKR